MHEPCVMLPAGHRQIANRQPVGDHRRRRFFFGNIHLIICRRVNHHAWILACESFLHLCAIADVHLRAIKSRYLIAALLEYGYQFDAQLPMASKHHRSFGFHAYICQRHRFAPTV